MEGAKVSFYKIRVKGHLDGRWTDWFDGLEITNLENGEAVLAGEIVDQAALHGLLRKVRDLGLPLISVTGVKIGPADGPDVKQQIESGYPEREKRDVFN